MSAATWCEIDDRALCDNTAALRRALTPSTRLGAVVKSDAYGHGLLQSAASILAGGADWLVVHAHSEALLLRLGGVQTPVLVCGPVSAAEAPAVASSGARVVAYDRDVVSALAAAGRTAGAAIPVHLKVETGTHRQGLALEQIVEFARFVQSLDGVVIEGACSHFADVEDGEDHNFARQQLTALQQVRQRLTAANIDVGLWHAASSAAAIALPESHIDMVRIGIGVYGLWPSSAIAAAADRIHPDLTLKPALAWRAHVSQVKDVASGASVGYGRTWRSRARRRLAILPVGYHEGFPRARSNVGHVLLRGLPAPVRGRVCMNLTMVDVTEVESATGSPVAAGEVATLLGDDGQASIRAEQFAQWAGTIHYEIIARIHPSVPRVRGPADLSKRTT